MRRVMSVAMAAACSILFGCDEPDAADGMSPAPAPSDAATPSEPVPDEPETGFAAQLAELLKCADQPNPTPLLIALAQAGRIDVSDNVGFDGLSCFALAEPIVLPARDGVDPLPVETICAFDETYPETLAGTPYEGRLYQRGPGTSPGMVIRAVVRETGGGEAYRWLQVSDARIGARIEPWSVVSQDPALVAITCSRLE
ncbi:MAG: hypothetical protein J0L52_07640 [Caulobacterales bacterium]|nr:hypothetical protein [Caulobacterales bacterium]